uniref:Xrn1 N-terminal domain-containing protein n=1 Tax=Trypanosoma congolense (strain IL3000) TaxID=1068625 RepID=G0UM25_TRYCI|nr:conserved hypothetical protein [Trypanosoma congolense IL3000]
MGILGLRKFIDSSSCTKLLPVNELNDDADGEVRHGQKGKVGTPSTVRSSKEVDNEQIPSSSDTVVPRVAHVLVDLNCIIHSSLGRGLSDNRHDGPDASVSPMNKRDLIQAVLHRLRFLLTQIVVPTSSLTICIDGPAPYAKLLTQRLRRRQASLCDSGGAQQLTSLAITPGSLLLVELENAIAAQFKLEGGRGFLVEYVPVFLHGSTVAGEGEAKIAHSMAYLAAACPSRGAKVEKGKYNPNDTVVVIGNDIDLTLTCMGATQYHNLFVLGPSSMQLISVSALLYRWLHASLQQPQCAKYAGEFHLTASELASVRIDFVFLFLLNGGDHYAGVGEVAHVLWRRYRVVRAASGMERSLVSTDLTSVDVGMLADVLQTAEYSGDADVKVGMRLLKAVFWSLQTTVTGVCPNYQFVPEASSVAGGPFLNHVRAAAAFYQHRKKFISFSSYNSASRGEGVNGNKGINKKQAEEGDGSRSRGSYLPLTPLETLVALMPTEASMPSSVVQALRSSHKYDSIAHTLLTSYDAAEIASAAQQAVEAADSLLTTSERFLRDFTRPVQINVLQKPRRLSRYEQHHMMATTGKVVAEEPMPVVKHIEMPDSFQYLGVKYPFYVKKLLFFSPFDRSPQSQSSPRDAEDLDSSCSHVDRSSSLRCHPSYTCPNEGAAASLEPHTDNVSSSSVATPNVRAVPAHPKPPKHMAPPMSDRREITSREGGKLDGRQRGQNNKLHGSSGRQDANLAVTREMTQQEAGCYKFRGSDEAFLNEIRGFLGEDDVSAMKSVLQPERVCQRPRNIGEEGTAKKPRKKRRGRNRHGSSTNPGVGEEEIVQEGDKKKSMQRKRRRDGVCTAEGMEEGGDNSTKQTDAVKRRRKK